jgi:hypothetical protein
LLIGVLAPLHHAFRVSWSHERKGREGKESEMPLFSSSIAATYFRFIYF